jgi:hypothetical protein
VIDPALEALPAEDKQYLQQHAALRAVLLTMEDLHLSELSYPTQVTLMQQLHATRCVLCLSIVTLLLLMLLLWSTSALGSSIDAAVAAAATTAHNHVGALLL